MSIHKDISKLENLPKKDILKAPEGYFETLPERILERIDEEETNTSTVWWPVYSAVAAVVVMLIVALVVLMDVGEPQSAEELLADVSVADISAYLEYEEVSWYELAAELDETTETAETETTVLPELELSEEELELLNERYDIAG